MISWLVSTFVFANEVSRFRGDIWAVILIVVTGFIMVAQPIKYFKGFSIEKFKEDFYETKKNNWKSSFEAISIFLLICSFIFIIYPNYLSREAIEIDNEFYNCTEKVSSETIKGAIPEEILSRGYILPKCMKESSMYAIYILDEILCDAETVDSADKEEMESFATKWDERIETMDSELEYYLGQLSRFRAQVALLCIGGGFELIVSIGHAYDKKKDVLSV